MISYNGEWRYVDGDKRGQPCQGGDDPNYFQGDGPYTSYSAPGTCSTFNHDIQTSTRTEVRLIINIVIYTFKKPVFSTERNIKKGLSLSSWLSSRASR